MIDLFCTFKRNLELFIVHLDWPSIVTTNCFVMVSCILIEIKFNNFILQRFVSTRSFAHFPWFIRYKTFSNLVKVLLITISGLPWFQLLITILTRFWALYCCMQCLLSTVACSPSHTTMLRTSVNGDQGTWNIILILKPLTTILVYTST